MKEIFQLRNSKYNLRKNPTFETRDVKSVFSGTETISYLGPKSILSGTETISYLGPKSILSGTETISCLGPKSVFSGTETISYLGPKIWKQVPNEIINSASINIFKNKIKDWIPNECPCRLCKVYMANLGFIYIYIYIFIAGISLIHYLLHLLCERGRARVCACARVYACASVYNLI